MDEPTVNAGGSRRRICNDYFGNSPYQLIEIVFCIASIGLAYLIRLLVPLNEVPIPYQIVNNEVVYDLSLKHPLVEKETVSDTLLIVFFIGIPPVILFLIAFLKGPRRDTHAVICTFFLSIGITYFVTDFLKLYVGRLRPNFYEYCGFDVETLQCTSVIDNSRKSFPSGHSSMSFTSMTVMSLYFLGKVGMMRGLKFRYDGEECYERAFSEVDLDKALLNSSVKKRVLCLLSIAPMFLAVFVAGSRVRDYYHFPSDVITGSVIGFVVAVYSYGLWYPSINSTYAGIPTCTMYSLQLPHDRESLVSYGGVGVGSNSRNEEPLLRY